MSVVRYFDTNDGIFSDCETRTGLPDYTPCAEPEGADVTVQMNPATEQIISKSGCEHE